MAPAVHHARLMKHPNRPPLTELSRTNGGTRATRLSAAASAVFLAALFQPQTAAAYSTKTLLSDPCHEELTFVALAQAREHLGEKERVEANANEQALMDDVPFPVNETDVDLAAISLVLGNRSNDFKGFESNDLNQLAPIHGNPDTQPEHCLRKPGQDGVAGSRAALAACREYIREHIEKALTGVGPDGAVDAQKKTMLKIALDVRGPVDAELPLFYVEMGHALHAIQDGFSHTFRTPDHMQVVTVLDFVETVADTHQTRQDGPAHLTALDQCTALDDLRRGRLETALRASSEFMVAVMDRSRSLEERRQKVDVLLDRYFTHAPDCGDPSGTCGAQEEQYRTSEGTCSFGPSSFVRATPGAGGMFIAMAVLAARRRQKAARSLRQIRSRRGRRGLGKVRKAALPLWASAAFVAMSACLPSPAAADTTEVTASGPPKDETPGTPWGVAARFSGSFDNPALAAAVGARYRVSGHFLVGVDGEYNPWFAQNASVLRPGVVSAYATFIFRVPLAFERVNLRSTVQLGASRMMFDLYGVPEGTIGPYFGLSVLGIDYELGRQFYLTFDPAHIAVPMPQISGVPFANPQYRVTVGFQWGG